LDSYKSFSFKTQFKGSQKRVETQKGKQCRRTVQGRGAENSVSVVHALIDRSANANTSFEVQSSRLAEGCGRINAKMKMPPILHWMYVQTKCR